MDTNEIVTRIAKICHEMNKTLCEQMNDFSQLSWDQAPPNIKQSAIDGVNYRLSNPTCTPEDMHNNWCKFKLNDGWSYGTVKDPVGKTHPCLVEYNLLPKEQKIKDEMFSLLVNTFKP